MLILQQLFNLNDEERFRGAWDSQGNFHDID